MALQSTGIIARAFTQNKFLKNAKPKDSTVSQVLCRLAAVEVKSGEIGTLGILRDRLDEAFSNLQRIGHALNIIDPPSATSLKKHEQEYQIQRDALLATEEKRQKTFEEKGKEVMQQLNAAPIPQELLAKSLQITQTIKTIEHQAEESYQNAQKILGDTEYAQRSSLMTYKKQLNSIETEKKDTALKSLVELEERVHRSQISNSRTKDATRSKKTNP